MVGKTLGLRAPAGVRVNPEMAAALFDVIEANPNLAGAA